MKLLFSLLFFSLFLAACGSPEGQEVKSGDAVSTEDIVKKEASSQYLVDPAKSKVIWEGGKATGTHTGELPVLNGQLIVVTEDSRLVAGQFAMDLRQMTNTDLPEDKAKELVGHLKSADFFEVEKYPMIQFDVSSVQRDPGEGHTHTILGNLTMKGKVRSVKIPANFTIADGVLTASTPKFTIDRTEWDVSYGSGVLGTAQDKIIYDEIGLQIELVANQE